MICSVSTKLSTFAFLGTLLLVSTVAARAADINPIQLSQETELEEVQVEENSNCSEEEGNSNCVEEQEPTHPLIELRRARLGGAGYGNSGNTRIPCGTWSRPRYWPWCHLIPPF